MRSRLYIVSLGLLIVLAGLRESPAQAQVRQHARYRVTDLGTLGGNFSQAFGMSNSGAVAGSATLANGDMHPFLWVNGTMMDLGLLGGTHGAAQNPTGSLATPMWSELATPDPLAEDFCGFGTHRVCRAAIWKAGAITPLPALGGTNAVGFSMNERGQMVGMAETAVPDGNCPAPQQLRFSPVVWGPNPGEVQVLPLIGGDTVGWAYGLNAAGQAVGATGACNNTYFTVSSGVLSGQRAVLWDSSGAHDLGNLGGQGPTLAVSVNNRLDVVGASSLPTGEIHGFLWSAGAGMQDIGVVGKDAFGAPSSINDSRQVVGGSCDAAFNCRAFLWNRGSMLDLNELVIDGPSLYLLFATWVNEAGEIAGFGIDENTFQIHAFYARPVGAPSTAGLKTAQRPILPESFRNHLRGFLGFGIPR
jgi:probable HAF family extracellular repeat protein